MLEQGPHVRLRGFGPIRFMSYFQPIDRQGARLLFQVVSKCCERRSLIVTTNLEFSRWGTVLTDDQMAAAMIDRIIHYGRLIVFEGPAKRMEASPVANKR